jgi:branched-chain amino acid transport system substrate-binding protein
VKAGAAGSEGAYFTTTNAASDTSDPDYATYTSAMNQYAPGVSHIGYSSYGFQLVMDTYRAMLTIPKATSVTAASVTTAHRQATAVTAFLGAGTTFTCNGKAVTGLPSLCASTFFLDQYTNGAFHYIRYSQIPTS